MVENTFPLLSHTACDILLWQSKLANTVFKNTHEWILVFNQFENFFRVVKHLHLIYFATMFFLIVVAAHSLSCVWVLPPPWTAAHQASPSFTISQSLLKLMSIEPVMPSNHLILCCSLLLLPSIFLSIRSLPMSQLFAACGQSIGASVTVLPMYIQGQFPVGLTGLISF